MFPTADLASGASNVSPAPDSFVAAPTVQAPTLVPALASTMSISAPAPPRLITVPLAFHLSGVTGTFSLDLRSHVGFQNLIRLYESATFVSAVFHVHVFPGVTRRVHFAVSGRAIAPAAAVNYAAAPVYELVAGATYSTVVESVGLPHSAAFGTELKAAVLGNATPKFHFRLEGGTAATDCAFVRGSISFTVAGSGLLAAI